MAEQKIDQGIADIINDVGGELLNIEAYILAQAANAMLAQANHGALMISSNGIDMYITKGGTLNIFNSDWNDTLTTQISCCPMCQRIF